jgi:hypothetical protein
MKKEFKKIGLVAILSLFSFGGAIAQEGAKKNVIGAGVSANMYYGIGGNLSYQRMLSPKLGVGARVVAVPLKYDDYLGTSLEFTNGKGFYTDISIGATYFFLGDATEAKFSMYSGLGLGYIMDKTTENIKYAESNVPFTNTDIRSGISGNLTLGTSYKMGPGKLFLEFMPSSIITGKDKDIYDYPAGSLTDANGNAIAATFGDYEYTISFPTTFTWTLGYTISF